MQRQADYLLRGVENGNAAVLQTAGIFGFEQQVEAVERYVRQALLQRLDIHAQAQRAPGVRDAISVTGIDRRKFFEQIRIEIGVPLQPFMGNGLQRTGCQPARQHAG